MGLEYRVDKLSKKCSMKTNTIALIVTQKDGASSLSEVLFDHDEIQFLETTVTSGSADPLNQVRQFREQIEEQENGFGDYVESLLSKPFLDSQIQKHCVQWLKSKLKIEQFEEKEYQAAQVIAKYAYDIFQKDSSQTDFVLASTQHQVRVRIFVFS